MNRYDGGKNGDGVYQRIINLIPPHKIWIEAFAGSAAITRKIRPAAQSFVVEAEPLQAGKLKVELRDRAVVYNADFFDVVHRCLQGPGHSFIFFDPPYLKSTRVDKRNLYKFEWNEDNHKEFLWWVKNRNELIMVTHPICELYLSALDHWNRIEYEYRTRVGMFKDCIWINYAVPERLHDYSYAGSDRIQRQRIDRKIRREIAKLATLPGIERNAIISAINNHFK